MGFELKDLIAVVRDEATAYAVWFSSCLSSPAYIGTQARRWTTAASDSPPSATGQFYVVLVISAFLGASIGSIIPGRPEIKDRLTAAIVVVLAWFLISLLTHGAVRTFGGASSVGITVKAMMQVLSLVYVSSNFLALIIVGYTRLFPRFADTLAEWGLGEPGTIIVGLQFLLLLAYVPLVIRRLYGFRTLAGCAAGALGSAFAAAVALVLIGVGGC